MATPVSSSAGFSGSAMVDALVEGGTWQFEDVHEELLFHAADRVIAAARSAAALRGGREPALSPGRWCAWCYRAPECPVADPEGMPALVP